MPVCRSLLLLLSEDIRPTQGGVEIPRDLQPTIVTTVELIARLVRKPKTILPLATIGYGNGFALLRAALGDGVNLETHPLHPSQGSVTSEHYRKRFEDVIARYSTAHTNGTPAERPTRRDEIYLALNAAVWCLSEQRGRCVVFPDAEVPWVVVAVEPAKLRCVTSDTFEEIALTTGQFDGALGCMPAYQRHTPRR